MGIGVGLEYIGKTCSEMMSRSSRGMTICVALFLILGCSAVPKNKPDLSSDSSGSSYRQMASPFKDDQFRVGLHTKLLITVYNEPDLTDEVVVQADGAIDYAYFGKIRIQGLTPEQVEEEITLLLLKDYLTSPQVKVKVKEFGIAYVLGKVKNPGIIKLTEYQTVLEGVVSAGGFSELAQKKQLQVVRTLDGQKKTFLLSLSSTQGGLDIDGKSLYLLPGDTIIVE